MKYLLDTDHISILQRRAGPEFAILWRRISRQSRADLGFSIVSFHEQVVGCHAYINRARNIGGDDGDGSVNADNSEIDGYAIPAKLKGDAAFWNLFDQCANGSAGKTGS